MKYILPFALLLTVFCFTACVDTEEKIEINADNSGNYSLTLDMGKMIGMMNDMGAGKTDPGKPMEKKDTTIYFKDAITATDKLTADEKELFKNAFCKLKLDEANAEMKIMISCPFADISSLATIKENLVAVMGKLDVMDKIGTKEKSALSDPQEMGGGDNVTKSMNPGSQYYKFTAAPGKLSYQVTDKAALKNSLTGDSSLVLMQQMSAITGEMSYKTIIVLPSPIKKLNGGKGVLSDDKKSITYKSTLSDLIERPEEVGYEIEY